MQIKRRGIQASLICFDAKSRSKQWNFNNSASYMKTKATIATRGQIDGNRNDAVKDWAVVGGCNI